MSSFTPPTSNIEMRATGRTWDAVRVPRWVAMVTLPALDESGAVIEDSWGAIWYWLIPSGAANGWALPGIQVLGRACYVAVPPVRRTAPGGVRWLLPPEPGRPAVSDPRMLHTALENAVAQTTVVPS